MTSINADNRDNKTSKGRYSRFGTIISLRWILVCLALIAVLARLSQNGQFTNSDCSTDANANDPVNSHSSKTDQTIVQADEETKVEVDRDALDCSAMLQTFREGKVEEVEETKGYEKSYVTRTKTQHPFYWATHSADLDKMRKSSFDSGLYYEKDLTQRIAEAFESDSDDTSETETKGIFLDVGGNIAWFSLLAVSHGASRVYTFEPNPINLVRICESLALNRWLREDRGKDVMVVIPKGVGDEITTQSFYRVTANNPGSFTFDEARAKRTGNVPESERTIGQFDIVTLDSFAQQRGWFDSNPSNRPSIAFFKLDVEGFEAKVLNGARKLFQSKIVQKFAMEMKPSHSESDVLLITEILITSGYELYMHGAFSGPANVVTKTYEDYKDLAKDISGSVYNENLLFRLASN